MAKQNKAKSESKNKEPKVASQKATDIKDTAVSKTPVKEAEKQPIPYKRMGTAVGIGAIALVAGASLALAGFTLTYKNKVYPHTYIGSVNYGGKNKDQARETLTQQLASFPQSLSITLDEPTSPNDKTTSFSLTENGVSYNIDQTVDALLRAGRSKSIFQNISNIFGVVFGQQSQTVVYQLNEDKTKASITKIANALGTQAQNAEVILTNENTVAIRDGKAGVGVQQDRLDHVVRESLGNLTDKITLASQIIQPTIAAEDTAAAVAYTQNILAKTPLTITADTATTNVDTKKLFSWIAYTPKQENGNTTLSAKLDAAKIKEFVTAFTVGVTKEPQNAELQAVNGQVTIKQKHVDGQKVNTDTAAAEIINSLETDTTGNTTIALKVEVIPATVKETNIVELGIKELIGRGETTFTGSPANRIHNITVGSNFLNGELVAPGQEFSTVKTLGAVDGSTGYLPELVIKENRTIPEFGGGLCQVSTTLFRSVLNAGLKVTERQNHSYRVAYYEPPVGLDATIYLPRPDFKFLNDTPGYILIQSKVVGTRITFELYGTKDGRTSTVSEPVVTNITQPPAPIYANTDTLPKGQVKQIEKPHAGARTTVTYTVMRNGQEINRQVFLSNYKAWPARFLVGTKETAPAPQ